MYVTGHHNPQTAKGGGFNAAVHAAVRAHLVDAARLILDCISKNQHAIDGWIWEYSVLPDSEDATDLLIENADAGLFSANKALYVLADANDAVALKGEEWASEVLSAVHLFRERYQEHLIARASRSNTLSSVAGSNASNVVKFRRRF